MTNANNGVILERLSGKKLAILVGVLLSVQVIFFLIGALKFPNATHTETVEGIMCRDKEAYAEWQKPTRKKSSKTSVDQNENLYYLRDYLGNSKSNCEYIEVDDRKHQVIGANPEEIIYAFQIPLPRDDQVLRLHRLFQTMTSILQLQVLLPPSDNEVLEETSLTHDIPMQVRLAYRNTQDLDDDWHQMANAKIKKQFTCLKGKYSLDCDMIQLFELGSVHHEFYLINLKLGTSKLTSHLSEGKNFMPTLSQRDVVPDVRITMTFIYQTGGFTQMWFIMKSCIFPFVFGVVCWYWNRVGQLDREANLLERMLLALGVSVTVLNLPVEWLSLWYDLKWMMLYMDLRQGIFYSVLLTFWIIFCGEHYIDESDTQKATKSFKSYWKYISALWVGCVCLLVFELSERGMQLSDPFFSMWDSKNGANFATGMLCVACISAILYFLLLAYLVVKVFRNFYSKSSQLPAMNKMRRAFYEGIIYRFKFLLVSTVVCAALTIAFFIVNNINDMETYFSEADVTLNYTGGFFTGVYAMWNVYATAVMIFYAPSHKNKLVAQHYEASSLAEEIGMQTNLVQESSPSRILNTGSVLTTYANKLAAS